MALSPLQQQIMEIKEDNDRNGNWPKTPQKLIKPIIDKFD